mgnify:CR=1 FL=1
MRPDIHEIMMLVAEVFATRSTCTRRQVGAVITNKHNREGIDFCQAVHAESNALINCANIAEARTLYVTTIPCVSCIKQLLNTPICTIRYSQTYPEATQSLTLWNSKPTRTVIQTSA